METLVWKYQLDLSKIFKSSTIQMQDNNSSTNITQLGPETPHILTFLARRPVISRCLNGTLVWQIEGFKILNKSRIILN